MSLATQWGSVHRGWGSCQPRGSLGAGLSSSGGLSHVSVALTSQVGAWGFLSPKGAAGGHLTGFRGGSALSVEVESGRVLSRPAVTKDLALWLSFFLSE